MNTKSAASLHAETLDGKEAAMLEQVADRLVRYGRAVGVTPQEIISLLDSGISIGELLTLLASRQSGAA